VLWIGTTSSPATLTYDDGVYGASVRAMRAGAMPFRDVFSSQGPIFLPLLWLADLVGGHAHWAPRLAPLAGGVALVVLTYRLAARVADRVGAVLAGVLVATSGTVFFTATALASDAIACAFATGAVAVAAGPSSRRRLWAIALLAGAALSVKSALVAPPVLAALWLVVHRDGVRSALRVAAGALATVVVASLPWGVHDVWRQYVAYHLHQPGGFTVADNVRLARTEFWNDDRLLLVAAALAIVTTLVSVAMRAPDRSQPWPRRPAGDRDVVTAMAIWLALGAALLILHSPLFVQHFTMTAPAIAVLVGRYRPPVVVLAVAALLVVPGQGDRVGWRLTPRDIAPSDAAGAALLERILPSSARIVSDDPGLVSLAGRQVPPDLVDTSYERIAAGLLTRADVAAAAEAPDVCAVVSWSGRFAMLGGLGARLTGYHVVLADSGRLVYLRDSCTLH
jgi:4-amino-4-deoxy-L-arabinose transferase-like glycosyltransferase